MSSRRRSTLSGFGGSCRVHATGIDGAPLGRWLGLQEARPVLDTGIYRRAMAGGRPDRRPLFRAFTPEGVLWQDGVEERVDVVLFATGYRPDLGYLAGISGAFGADGMPRQQAGISLTIPGLAFLGLPAQRTWSSATLRGVSADARYVVRGLRRYLDTR